MIVYPSQLLLRALLKTILVLLCYSTRSVQLNNRDLAKRGLVVYSIEAPLRTTAMLMPINR
jgi:hypothetical protein